MSSDDEQEEVKEPPRASAAALIAAAKEVDLSKLAPEAWLNDVAINAIGRLVTFTPGEEGRTTVLLPTYFFALLRLREKGDGFEPLIQRGLSEIPGNTADLLVIIPIHRRGEAHWALASIATSSAQQK